LCHNRPGSRIGGSNTAYQGEGGKKDREKKSVAASNVFATSWGSNLWDVTGRGGISDGENAVGSVETEAMFATVGYSHVLDA